MIASVHFINTREKGEKREKEIEEGNKKQYTENGN
jgi:hypothetical protein